VIWGGVYYLAPDIAAYIAASFAGVYGAYLALTVAYDLWQARALKRERAALIVQYADAKAKRQKTRQGHVYARLRAINAKLLRGA
jgi:plasmid maintenance system antidote protein VapI